MHHLILIAALIGCGTDNSEGESPDKTSSKKQDAIDYEDSKPKEVVTEYRKEGSSYAIAVEDTSELPECTRANNKQLAWVKTSEIFFSCEDGDVWVEIESVKGAEGAKGEKGDKGDKGDPGEPVAQNEWLDPITKKEWLFGAKTSTRLISASACSNGYHLPSSAEAIAAVVHGLLVASNDISGPTDVWVSDPPEQPSPNDYSFYVNSSGARVAATTDSHGIVCVKD